jgi:sugar lactone lactonase YvrE
LIVNDGNHSILNMKKFFAVVSLLGIFSCSKSGGDNDPNGEPNPNPNPGPGGNTELTITTVTPNSGEILPAPVTINGTGFNTTATNNTVHVSGVPATVTSATATALQVTLPANLNAGDHDIRVAANGKSATKTNAFHLVGWIVSNFVGSGNTGQTDGTGDGASFQQPVGLTIDAAGNFYVCDLHRIRKITPQGVVTTVAGSGAGFINGNGQNARFRFPTAIAIDAANNLYVADQGNSMIRKITPAGDVTTVAGKAEELGRTDGIGDAARFSLPYGITIDPAGTSLYVGDHGNDVIRKINLGTNEVTTVAGNGTRTRTDAKGLLAGIPGPGNLAFDADGNLIITEKGAGMIRKMAPGGNITTIGDPATTQDVQIQPTHLAFDKDKNIYVTFSNERSVRKYAPDASWMNFAGASAGPNEENGPANVIQFQRPEGIVVKEDAQGNKVFYITDAHRKKIKKISKQ